SLIRCSLSKKDLATGRYLKSGDIIAAASQASKEAVDFVDNCSRRFLSDLPPRLETVVMLSNDDDYVDQAYATVQKLHPLVKRLNSVAYGDGRVTWVHVVHAAMTSGRHF